MPGNRLKTLNYRPSPLQKATNHRRMKTARAQLSALSPAKSDAMKDFLAMLRKSPLYYWHTGERIVALGAKLISALIVVLLLIVIPVAALNDAPWAAILALLLGFALKAQAIWFMLLLGLLYLVAPGPVAWLMGFMPVWFLALGAIWGAIQSRLLAGYLYRWRRRKTAPPACPRNEGGQ